MGEIKKSVEALVKKAEKEHSSEDALRFSEAALNVARAHDILKNIEIVDETGDTDS